MFRLAGEVSVWPLSGSFRPERGHSAVDMMQFGDDWYASGEDREA